jgi:hypothetical protein
MFSSFRRGSWFDTLRYRRTTIENGRVDIPVCDCKTEGQLRWQTRMSTLPNSSSSQKTGICKKYPDYPAYPC